MATIVISACGDGERDEVEVAERRVADAQDAVNEAQSAFDQATVAFCEDSEDYIATIDRYGQVFDQAEATVGDVTTAAADLEDPREAAESSAAAVVDARDELAEAEQELADATAALAVAQSSTTAVTTTSSTTTTTTPLVPAATVDRVERAESELAAASEGIAPRTPLSQATEQLNAAGFALEVAWLRLFADAGCLNDEQEQQAVTAIAEYTAALQTSLQTAGYYDGEIDGVYGPATVAAVEALQTASDLPVTGLVDQATALALNGAVVASGADDATQALAHTAAVQSTLKLAGYWTGPVDGEWTPELTAALEAFQTALGVSPTGVVDTSTMSALQQSIAEAQAVASSTTTTAASTTTTSY